MKFNAIGPATVGGLGHAYDMHSDALGVFHRVECYTLDNVPDNGVENTYYHGAAAGAHVVKSQGRNIAYWVCESTKLQEEYFHHADRFTDIWTASTYCQRVLETELSREVKLVPHCVTRYRFTPQQNDVPIILVPFDGFSRFVRKNPLGAVNAVKDAFGKKCKLVIKGKNVRPSYRRWIRKECEGLNTQFLFDPLSYEEMDKLYSLVDIVFSMHLSEGFGLHLLEGMAFAKKVVATAWGGNVDFMNEENSFLVDATETDVIDDYFKGTWGLPSHEHAVEQLRAAADAPAKVNNAAFDTAMSFSMMNTINATRNALA